MNPLVAELRFLVEGEFAAWLEEQSPTPQLLELVAVLRAVHQHALHTPVPPLVVRPLLEALLGDSWLAGRWLPSAAHQELEGAARFLSSLHPV